ncbi:hypothetical protein C8J57DRAFT_1463193 [Mycena rebaudengoi]|nr:hypothetical protein C8J57DRAFT_1463193 [Mycena rebaudengoi]
MFANGDRSPRNITLAFAPPPTASELRSRLMEIEEQVERLAVEKKNVLECLDSIIYPILTLPPEIMSDIFLHYCRGLERGQLQVASICKAWRAIALTTPALWSDFSPSWRANQNLPKLLQCWLPRAGSLPLTLGHIELGEFTHDAILASLALYSSQWMSLDLHAQSKPISFPIDSICTPLSALIKLKIRTPCWPAGSFACMTAFLDAPQLREVDLCGLSLSSISLPWIQLTHLTFSVESLIDFFEILQQAPNLEGLVISFNDSLLQTAAPPPCTLFRLDSLTLSDGPHHRILDYLTLPALHRLEMLRMRAEGCTSVQSLVERSGCSIQVLQLMQTALTVTCDCLSNLPSLTEVTIKYPGWSTADFGQFFERISDKRAILPALEALNIVGPKENIDLYPLLSLLSLRRTGAETAQKLKSFQLLFSPICPQDYEIENAAKKLRDLRADGLEMNITWAPKWISPCIDSQLAGFPLTFRFVAVYNIHRFSR